ncbi:MAG: penicillin-binding protein 2 [bacterium]
MKYNPYFHDDEADTIPSSSFDQQEYDAAFIVGSSTTIHRTLTFGKLLFFGLCFFIGGTLLLGRLVNLQIGAGERYRRLSDQNRLRQEVIVPPRGGIFDRDGRPLVATEPQFVLVVEPGQQWEEELLKAIANVAGVTVEELAAAVERADKQNRSVAVKEGLDRMTALVLLSEKEQYQGITIKTEAKRNYLYGSDLAPVLGYLRRITEEQVEAEPDRYTLEDLVGAVGVEARYEEKLRGIPGKTAWEVDARGRKIDTLAAVTPVSGDPLTLSIDLDLQLASTKAWRNWHRNSTAGAIIISNPNNGEILSLLSFPEYDPADTIGKNAGSLLNNQLQPLLNRAIAGLYPSGSTIKPLYALAALDSGVINDKTTVVSNGGIRIGQQFFADWKTGGHGLTNVYKAIAESVNTFFYAIGGGWGKIDGLGADGLVEALKKIGFGKATGIDLVGERDGTVPKPKEAKEDRPWYIGDTYNLSIGQGDLLVTPLQINSMTSFIANGGTLYQPHVVKDQPNVIKAEKVFKPETIGIVQTGMRQTVTIGSARALQTVPVPVAGKTGTAQWSKNKQTHAWFTGYAPAGKPEIAVTVLVESGGEGSAVAVPVARDIFNFYFKNKGIDSDL